VPVVRGAFAGWRRYLQHSASHTLVEEIASICCSQFICMLPRRAPSLVVLPLGNRRWSLIAPALDRFSPPDGALIALTRFR